MQLQKLVVEEFLVINIILGNIEPRRVPWMKSGKKFTMAINKILSNVLESSNLIFSSRPLFIASFMLFIYVRVKKTKILWEIFYRFSLSLPHRVGEERFTNARNISSILKFKRHVTPSKLQEVSALFLRKLTKWGMPYYSQKST